MKKTFTSNKARWAKGHKKKDSENKRESDSSKISMKNIYSKPLLES